MNRDCFKGLWAVLVVCCLTGGGREAAADVLNWPTLWTALPDPCNPAAVYTEPHNDFPGAPGLHYLDIVGSDEYPAGFRASDDDHLYFRMRVDKTSAVLAQTVWQFLLDTDLDPNGYVDYSLQLDNKVDFAVEFVPASPGGPLFAQVNLSHTTNDGHWSGSIAGFSRIIVDTGDTNLGGPAPAEGPNDSFIDVAMPWADFEAKTGLNRNDFASWRVYLTTSTSHIQVTMDTPDCGEPHIPEPGTATMLSLLGALGLLRRRLR
ncbi:MAG: hypothetical protein GX621_12415 [Pirellulaceae bacterium]|nr:hypothetical protein [Pirellulaceae bacterium]